LKSPAQIFLRDFVNGCNNNNNNNSNNKVVHADREVTANRPDIIIKNKKEKKHAH
jgi:hypothetical protein